MKLSTTAGEKQSWPRFLRHRDKWQLRSLQATEAIYRRANTSRRHPRHAIYPYLLRNLTIERPNQVWATDVSYIPMARGFVYLVAVIDWFSCQRRLDIRLIPAV